MPSSLGTKHTQYSDIHEGKTTTYMENFNTRESSGHSGPVSLAFGTLRQKDHGEFEDSLDAE